MKILRLLFLMAELVLLLALSGEHTGASPQAAITLNLSNPTCTQVKTNSGRCSINLLSLSANSSDPTFSHVEITIDGKVRANYTTFFESSINVNYAMLGDGLQVSCGRPNAGGDPSYGNQYQVVVTAYLADIPTLTDTANVYCPYFSSKYLMPLVSK
jgi:hypothetical protein